MMLRIAAIALLAVATVSGAADPPAKPSKWADPAKTLRVMFPVAETGFDPAPSQDYYSAHVLRVIFDTLYVPDYLRRPYAIAPNAAAAMPEFSADGKTWTIRLKPGIYFTDDPAFKGQRRELTASDYVYSWKRVVDPKVRSPNSYYLEGKLVGLDDLIAKAKSSGKFDYDSEIDGLRAIDRYTLQMKLVEADYTLMPYLLQSSLAAVAREVIEAYGDASTWAADHPVGTGPYRLKEWRRGQKIVLEANPGFRDEHFPAAPPGADAETQALAAAMKGKRLPQIGTIDISIIEESNPQLLAFASGSLDYANVPADLATKVLDPQNRLLPEFARENVALHRAVQPALTYTYFNMEDPLIGGYTPDRIALRRAIVMGFDVSDLIRVIWQGQAQVATQQVPPGSWGHIPGLNVRPPFDPATARLLLDRFGYKDRDGDGYRETPDGKPLTLVMGSTPTGRDRERDELWKKSMDRIGIRVDFTKQKWPDLLKMSRAGQLMSWPVGWITNDSDGNAFMQLLYGPNSGKSNLGRFKNAEYDALYAQSKHIPYGPERDKLYRKMAEVGAGYTPWDLGVFRIENTLVRPWVQGYKKNIYFEHAWKFLDIDVAKQKK